MIEKNDGENEDHGDQSIPEHLDLDLRMRHEGVEVTGGNSSRDLQSIPRQLDFDMRVRQDFTDFLFPLFSY